MDFRCLPSFTLSSQGNDCKIGHNNSFRQRPLPPEHYQVGWGFCFFKLFASYILLRGNQISYREGFSLIFTQNQQNAISPFHESQEDNHPSASGNEEQGGENSHAYRL